MIKLYKYQSFQSFENFYANSYLQDKVHFSNWNELNDPLEGYFRHNYYQELTGIIDQKNHIKILSLADNYQNMVMWAHYGSIHRGICLEYTIDDVNLNLDENFSLQRIQYQDDFPSVNNDKDFKENAISILSHKLSPWNYEKETRILYFGDEALVNNKSIKLTRVILGALAGEHNLLKFIRIYKAFQRDFLGEKKPLFLEEK